MNNFGEELAYWYLRLNGFFPLMNYVQHEGAAQDGEIDIVALRLPQTRETVRDIVITWDDEQFPEVGIDLNRDMIAVLAEVKSGGPVQQPDMNGNRLTRLRGAIERTGIFGAHDVDGAVQDLTNGYLTAPRLDHRVIIKVLFHNGWPEHQRWAGWHAIDLRHADRFIRRRFREYAEKHRGWVRFPSDLI